MRSYFQGLTRPPSLRACAALAACAMLGGCTKADTPKEAALTILSLNLQTFAVQPDFEARTQMVVDLIREAKPDLIALQEAAESSLVANRAEVIANQTGYSYVWTATEVDPNADYHGGPAVLSRWPILSQEIAELPHLDFDGEVRRRIVRVVAETPAGPVALVATHTTTSDEGDRKLDQAIAGAEFLAAGRTTLPGFYAGDFNAEPDSEAMRALRGELEGGLDEALIDAWQQTHAAAPGHTYPSRAPARRIDYIYAGDGTQLRARPRDCELVLGDPVEELFASDHLGLLCTFDFEELAGSREGP